MTRCRSERIPITREARLSRMRTAPCYEVRWKSEGFTVNPEEWWHFDYKDWQLYPIMNVPFEQLKVQAVR